MPVPILSVKNLTTKLQIGKKIYKVVDNLSFDLHSGKTIALVGESGCGKSVTAHSLLRILPTPPFLPPEGEIIYKHRNLLKLSEGEMRKIRGARIAMIFQDPSSALNPVYTIGNQLMEVAELHLGLYGDEGYARCIEALIDVGISSPNERMLDYPHQLSGGMKQRVMIAMALICQPDILIADEPTTALDVTIQAQVLELIRSLQEKLGMAVLLITHNMGVVAEAADEVIVMYATQGIESGSVNQIFSNMSHPYTVGLFQSHPSPDETKEKLTPIKGSVPMITKLPEGCKFNTRCPYVMERCYKGDVPNFLIEQGPNHMSKCWLFDPQHIKREV